MHFFAKGKPVLPIRFDEARKEARFTLRDKNHRFYVVTTCLEQYELLQANPGQEVLAIGTAYSFKIGVTHQVGFKPMILLPLTKNSTEQVEQIITQLVKFSLNDMQV